MQKQAKTTAGIMYEALHSAFDKLSDNLTQLITGARRISRPCFRTSEKQVLNSSIKQGLQKGLGAPGRKAGHRFAETQRLDGQTEPGALWVRLAAQLGGDTGPAKAAAIPGLKSDQQSTAAIGWDCSSIMGFLGNLLGSLVGATAGGGSGGGETVTSSITMARRATGGPVTPDKAYLVNERGTEDSDGCIRDRAQQFAVPQDAGWRGRRQPLLLNRRAWTDPVLTEQRTRVAIMGLIIRRSGLDSRLPGTLEAHAAEVSSHRMTARSWGSGARNVPTAVPSAKKGFQCRSKRKRDCAPQSRIVAGSVGQPSHGFVAGSVGQPSHLIYFSFTILTTVGFGDVHPVTPAAQALNCR